MVPRKPTICSLLILAILAVLPLSTSVNAADKGYQGRVILLRDHTYFDALISGIRKAKKEITGCFFIFKVSEKNNGLPRKLVNELIAAKRRGVSIAFKLEQDARGKGTVYEQNRRAAALLSEAGIKVRFDAPKTTTHVKAMVIDGRYVYMGSHNLTQSALKYNHELSVMIDSAELAAEVTAYINNF